MLSYAYLDPNVAELLGSPLAAGACATGFFGVVACLLTGRRAWRVAAALGSAYLLVVAGFGSIAPESPLPEGPITWGVVAGLIVLGNLFTAQRMWDAGRLLGRLRRARIDLRRGIVEQFAGRGDEASDSTLRRLAADGYLAFRSATEHQIELLPRSGLVLRAQGRSMDRLAIVHIARVARCAPHAFRTELPQGVAPDRRGPRLTLKRRSLTADERDELATHIRHLRRRYWPAIAMTLVLVVLVALELRDGLQWRNLLRGRAIGWYLLAALTYVAYVRRVWAARKLEHDRDLRWVVTVEDEPIRTSEPRPPRLEVLPVSQLAWTENANPAGWRVSEL
jgi:hypothetical protein